MHVRVHVHDFCQDKLIFSFKDQNFQNVVQQAGIVILFLFQLQDLKRTLS